MGNWQPGNPDQRLAPQFRFLSDPAVLVQAWKKAHAYVRHHNWYADSLELDVSTIHLPTFLDEWSALLRPGTYRSYSPDYLRLVPAPKSSPWDVSDGWKPTNRDDSLKLRPLAHVSIRDQTLAMAFLMCFADVVETAQGRPEIELAQAPAQGVVSYGHRLVCSWDGQRARFRWGNAKLYRQYFDDYQSFVQRPEVIRKSHFHDANGWAVVSADLSQFYDNIKRDVLLEKLRQLVHTHQGRKPDDRFFDAMGRVFAWNWHPEDQGLAQEHFGRIEPDGLPQGLAASGFFSNVYLLDFDRRIVADFNRKYKGRDWRVIDYCRYVDDMRFLLEVPEGLETEELKSEFNEYLTRRLAKTAPGLSANPDKTQIKRGDAEAASTPIADTMRAVVTQISGPLDVATARQALEELDGLLATSTRRREELKVEGTGQDEALRRLLAPEPDVRNETVERFVAHRWRRVYRSLRIMSDAEGFTDSSLNVGRAFLDQQAEAFATDLIRRWIQDPSNVRLLRVAMDIYPLPKHLEVVLKLLDAYLNRPSDAKARKVCAYVAAELLRAGATETGFTHDPDELPSKADVSGYRQLLLTFARQQFTADSPPWYLIQQAMLFMATMGESYPEGSVIQEPNKAYEALHDLLKGRWPQSPEGVEGEIQRTLPLLLVAHRLSGDTTACAAALAGLMYEIESSEVRSLLVSVLTEDEELLNALWDQLHEREAEFWREHFTGIGYLPQSAPSAAWEPEEGSVTFTSLLTLITSPANPFRQETIALRLLDALVREWAEKRQNYGGSLAPARIDVMCRSWRRAADPTYCLRPEDFQIRIHVASGPEDRRYKVPDWCPRSQHWRIEIGQILRAAILGQRDYSLDFRMSPTIQVAGRYRPVATSWYKRKHGLYSGRSGLGDRLLAISPWLSELLSKLLVWPGADVQNESVAVPPNLKPAALKKLITDRFARLSKQYCQASALPCYEYALKLPDHDSKSDLLRVAVVQSVLPYMEHFSSVGPGLNDPVYRRKHRRHLTAVLRLVLRTLEIREGYKEQKEQIDLVVFPELAVHVNDLGHLIRFADSIKCVVFSGLVFHEHPHIPDVLVNSGVWILPARTAEGRAIDLIEQGKENLTDEEKKLGIVSYRPCQWLIEGRRGGKPWRITGTICYDATDLRLAADMRDKTDAFVVAAMNKDTGTFDTMASALHYHMYQHLILANTGQYGGTTVQAPYKAPHKKVLVHHHGMDSVVVSVFELDLLHFRGAGASISLTGTTEGTIRDDERKHPPAGFCR